MVTDEFETQAPPSLAMPASWQATVLVGALTLILGLVVTFHPTSSLNVVAILLGILMIFSGIFHLVRVFDANEVHRVWVGIVGLLFVVIGVLLIRHLNLTLAIIGVYIGITWIVQGLVSLIAGFSGGTREGRIWWIAFGAISLIAGVVVAVAPVTSLSTLAVLLGMWFVIMGIFEIVAGFMLRQALSRTEAAQA
jgi:uncharacterized membrane protein HdeD (DUF308 family)